MRTACGIIVILAFAVTSVQDSFDLRNHYGPPDEERFAIRPDITMAVEYGSGGKACILDFEPRQAFIHGMTIRQATFSEETALGLLDEVTPPEIRGKLIAPLFGSVVVEASCGGFEFGESRTSK